MTANELIQFLKKHPDFEVEFILADEKDGCLHYRTFTNLDIADIGYSSKVILLTGDEKE